MDLEKFLSQEKATIVERWLEHVLETYSPQAATLMKKETNQFANPVGYSLRHGIESIWEEFLQGLEPEKVKPFLDSIIRIRAVQEFTPSQALQFVFGPKRIVRRLIEEARQKAVKKNKKEEEFLVSADQMETFDSKVDHLALLAFDVYSKCRETLYEVRLSEVKNRSFRLLQRANLLAEIPDSSPGPAGEEKH